MPAIAAAIGLRCYASVEPTPCSKTGERVLVDAPSVGFSGGLEEFKRVSPGLSKLLEALAPRDVCIHVRIACEAPIGAGLGSSAASSVALAAALLEASGASYTLDDVWRYSFEAEILHHGKPSGIDNTVAVYGGVILFHTRGVWERILAPGDAILVVADTGVPRSTKRAVERVLARFSKFRSAMNRLYESMLHMVHYALDALRRGDLQALGELMDVSHGMLYALGVSTPEIERIVWAARRAGAYGAKLTGAGLGGCVIALCDDEERAERIRSAMVEAGAKNAWIVKLGVEGLRREEACRYNQ